MDSKQQQPSSTSSTTSPSKQTPTKSPSSNLESIKESTVSSSGLGEFDVPTDEVAAAAEQIRKDVTQQLHQTEAQLEQSFSSFKQTVMGLMNKDEWGTISRKQKATSIQWWHDFNHEPFVSKFLLGGLILTNLCLPLLFLNHRESWLVMSTYLLVSITSHFLYQTTPARSPDRFVTSLFSHLLWIPLLFWLSSRVSSFDVVTRSTSMEHVDVSLKLFLTRSSYLSAWIRSVIIMNGIVLFCDVIKMSHVLQAKMLPKTGRAVSGHAHIQTKPHISEHGKFDTLIDNNQDDHANRIKEHQEGIKHRLRHSAAPTA